MAEPLKNVYSEQFVSNFLSAWKQLDSSIDKRKFESFVFDESWKALELKARMSRLAEAMKLLLPKSFPTAAHQVTQLVKQLLQDEFPKDSFEFMFIPEYIEQNGLEHLEESLNAFEEITQFTSCEFAIRPFIIRYEKVVMKKMLEWSTHPHASVRRFSSEGCRPRLPWAMAINSLKKDASPILPILENLKADSSLFVRKSVANNLNDISKDHPELILKIAKSWLGKNEHTNWIIKHACRTLLKAGHPEAMQLFGYAPIQQLKVSTPDIKTPVVQFGKDLIFEFSLSNTGRNTANTRIEYAIHYLKNNGSESKKVFKISERELEPNQEILFSRKHSIKPISTRKYYAGQHGLSLIINGIESKKVSFLLNI